MRFVRISLLCALCIALLACSKDNSPTDNDNNSPKTGGSLLRFTLDGPDVNNRLYELKDTYYNAGYLYDETEGYSSGSLIGINIVLTINFPGKSTGSYAFGENGFVGLSVNTDDEENQIALVGESGTLTISEANVQAKLLKGTFSGTFMSTENRTYTVSNASFTIQRK